MAEEDPWGFDDGDVDFSSDAPMASSAAADTGSLGGGSTAGAAGAGGGGGGVEGRPVMEPMDEANYRKPLTLYKHWVRPRFLQYDYMYDYRRNYYNDVIDYLDMRNRGLKPEVPRAQTWAERVLRTHNRTDDVYNLMKSSTMTSLNRSSSTTTVVKRPVPSTGGYDVYDSYLTRKDGEPRQIQTLSSSIRPTNYHSRAYLFRKYASVL